MIIVVRSRMLVDFPLKLSSFVSNSPLLFSGEHNIQRREGSEQHFAVKRIVVHPYYQRATTNNDMGE